MAMEYKLGNEGSKDMEPARCSKKETGFINSRDQHDLISRRIRWFSGKRLLGKVSVGLVIMAGSRDEEDEEK